MRLVPTARDRRRVYCRGQWVLQVRPGIAGLAVAPAFLPTLAAIGEGPSTSRGKRRLFLPYTNSPLHGGVVLESDADDSCRTQDPQCGGAGGCAEAPPSPSHVSSARRDTALLCATRRTTADTIHAVASIAPASAPTRRILAFISAKFRGAFLLLGCFERWTRMIVCLPRFGHARGFLLLG